MNKISTNEKEFNLIKKNRKKWLLIIIVLIVIAISIIAVGFVLSRNISSAKQGDALEEQLELGNKYLNELDYEQTIVAYETAIEIDPMSVDAYLGLASAYEQQGNYDKALEVLELGYEKTQSEFILEEIERIKAIISQGGNEQTDSNFLAADSKYPIAVPGRVVEGIYHNPYYEYPLSNEDKAYLVQIIEQAEQGNYESALYMVDNDRLITIVEKFADGESYINTMVDDKKVHIFTNVFDNEQQFYSEIELIVLPLEMGEGYYFSNTINRDNNRFENDFWDQDVLSYGFGECKEGVFWGDYTWKQTIVTTNYSESQETIINTTVIDGEATLYNGLFDGQYTYSLWSDYDNVTHINTKTYNMGLVKYWNLQDGNDAEYEYCTFAWGYMNDEEEYITTAGSAEVNREWLDSERFSITQSSYYKDYCEIDGGWRYYYW